MEGIHVFDLAQAAKGRILCGNPNQEIRYICTNSREVQEGDLFVPLIGAKVDAHCYLSQALEAGAQAVLTSEHNEVLSDKAWIRVEDTKKALQDIGEWYRKRLNLPLVGITGSVGKTTTREMTALALAKQYRIYKTPGNRNSQIGVPISICEISQEDEIGIIELGISEPGEMHKIAMVAKVSQAVVTNIGEAHIGQLGSKENICKEKLHIQDGMEEGGILFVNGDDPILQKVRAKAGCRTVFYGRGENCDYRIIDIRKEDGYPVFTVLHQKSGEKIPVKLSVFGNHMIANAAAAIAVAGENGVSLADAARGIALFNGLPGRQQVLKGRGVTIINDSYNASPASMKAGIIVLCDVLAKAERIAVLADMKELGEEEIAYHREIGRFLAEQPVDQVVLLGELAGEIGKQMEENAREQIQSGKRKPPVYFSDREEMTQWLKKEQKPGDVLLLKGSNAMGLSQVASQLLS